MIDLNLLKLTKGVGKNGKDYYQVTLTINNEIIRAFIWDNQYEAIKKSLTPEEQLAILTTRTNNQTV